MCTKSFINLAQLSDSDFRDWFHSFDAIIADGPGTLWQGNYALPGAVDFVNGMAKMKKPVYCCTNNASNTKSELEKRLKDFGLQFKESQIITPINALVNCIKAIKMHNLETYVIGKSAIGKALDEAKIKHSGIGADVLTNDCLLGKYLQKNLANLPNNVGAVVVSYDEQFHYVKMLKAVKYLQNPKCAFFTTSLEMSFSSAWGEIPSVGVLAKTISAHVQREPTVTGKPSRNICATLIDDQTLVPARTLVIGDSGPMDMLLGHNCEFKTLLVGTGESSLEDVQQWIDSPNSEMQNMVPDAYVQSLANLQERISDVLGNEVSSSM